MARRRPASRRERERFSEPGEEDSSFRRVAIGCGIGCAVLVLLLGAVGIGVGAHRRLAGWGESDQPETPDEPSTPATPQQPTHPTPTPPTPPAPDRSADMQRRYRPGPTVRVESMVPSGRLLPLTTTTRVIAGRTIDNPWVVPGSELVPDGAPAPAASGAPSIWHDSREPVGQPLTVISRTPSRTLVGARDASGGSAVMAYLVEFVGYQGHFRLPATAPTELGAVSAGGSEGATIHFAIASPIRPGGGVVEAGQQFPVTMRIAAVDDQGRVSQYVTRELNVMAVGAGDVEVTLTMTKPTDLDLYVTDPSGTTIYFSNTNAASGGHLDLDANAACSSNVGVNNEHVFWAQGRAPAGTYRVNVAHWRNCVQGGSVGFRVTVRACGETVVLSGTFQGEGRSETCLVASPNDPAWCQQVVTFDVPPC